MAKVLIFILAMIQIKNQVASVNAPGRLEAAKHFCQRKGQMELKSFLSIFSVSK
jgi:hypothetical protein